MNVLKVNLGCASQTPDEWINVDYALGARLLRLPLIGTLNKRLKLFRMDWDDSILIHDLRKRFPWESNSIGVVYSSHTLEHFSRKEGLSFLRECYRVLEDDGLIRIVVPDLRAIVNRYVQGEIPADDFLDHLHVKYERDGEGCVKSKLAPFIRYPHKCMYDTDRLIAVLEGIGFLAESRRPFESAIPDIDEIELHGRTEDAVIVEARKRSENDPQ